jgi:beta-1,4-mannosyl-glycoprotein beta-1,4-N-acetylglucosaminyltransferase
MKVHDCTILFNEIDLLELRLNTLNDVVDHFVIAEAECSHQNKPKPLYFQENRERFKKFEDKITYIVVPAEEFTDDSWANERYQTESTFKGIQDADPEDTLLVGFLDEIPDPKDVKEYHESERGLVSNLQKFYIYYLNTRFNHRHSPTLTHPFFRGTTFLTRKMVTPETYYDTMMVGRQGDGVPEVEGGWHFTFLGDGLNAFTKIQNYGHTEFSHIPEDYLKHCFDNLADPLCRGDAAVFSHFEPEELMPEYVLKNKDKYNKYIKDV